MGTYKRKKAGCRKECLEGMQLTTSEWWSFSLEVQICVTAEDSLGMEKVVQKLIGK